MAPTRATKRARVSTTGAGKMTFASPAYVRTVNRKYRAMKTAYVPATHVSRRFARRVSDNLKEKKYFDTSIGVANLGSDTAAANLVTDLAIIPQGNTVSTRIGKRLRVTSLQIKATVYANPVNQTTINYATMVRMSIVWDREPDKAALVPVTTDIYNSNNPNCPTNRDNAPRFKILREIMIPIAAPGATAGTQTTATPDTSQCNVNEFISFKKKDLEIIWTKADTTGATANKVKGNLLLCWTLDQTQAQGGVAVLGNVRLDYQDS